MRGFETWWWVVRGVKAEGGGVGSDKGALGGAGRGNDREPARALTQSVD